MTEDHAARTVGGILIPPGGFALVFMGGGAKGAYQLGVWQALRELEIPIAAVGGASIGSINGALLAQGDFDRALETWHSVHIDQIVRAEGLASDADNLLDPRNLAALTREIVTRRGLDTAPLRTLLASLLDEDAIRRSPVDFGLVTFSKAKLVPVEFFTADIPRGQLVDYIMASACFPIFKSVQLGDGEFIDGGVGDNMPVGMMLRRGYRNIITVDIGGVGLVRPVRPGDANILPIRYSVPLGGLFDLAPEVLDFNQRVGYLDTMKAFGQLRGVRFFFSPEEYGRLRARFSRHTCEGLEEAALLYGLPQDRPCTAAGFFAALEEAFLRTQPRFEERLRTPAITALIQELREGTGPTSPLEGPLLLHSAMEALAGGQPHLVGKGLLLDKRLHRAAEAMLTLVRLGGL